MRISGTSSELRVLPVHLQEPELDYLRKAWYTPATLLRHLSNSGYNFVLKDTDADYTPDILPKSHVCAH